MKILLTHAYFLHEDPKEKKIMRPYPPLGLLYISAYLEKHGLANQVFDTTFSSKANFRADLLKIKPDVIGIYTNLMTKVNVVEIMQFIKNQESLKHCKIIVGGPDLRYNIENYLHNGADFLVIGEGEATMLELIRTLQHIDVPNYHLINGLAFVDKEGGIVQTAERKRIRPIDSLPWPNRKAINLQKYLDTWKTHHGQSAMSVSTQRGCPYTCRWCSTAVYGQSYRRRSPENVVAELLHIKKTYNPDTIWFVDDVFTVSHKWLEKFRDEIRAQNAMIPFECITRADRLNEEVITMLKEAGAFRVWIGAESGSQRIIDAMDRRVKVEVVREMIQKTRANGIQAGTFIMLGYPGETEQDILETIHHLKVANPDYFTITVAYPIKGTGLYNEVEADRTTDLDWATSTDRQIDFVRTYPRSYYNYALSRVVNEVNLHKKRLNKEHLNIEGLKMQLKVTRAKLGMWWHGRQVK